jgi:glycine cleavage system H protein
MATTKYTQDHEWARLDGDVATVGITHHAQEQLGDVVFVEMPEVGKTVSQGDDVAVVESVKAASEVYAPVDGEITEVNGDVDTDPSVVNADCFGKGWFWKMTVSDTSQFDALMDEDAYAKFVEENG